MLIPKSDKQAETFVNPREIIRAVAHPKDGTILYFRDTNGREQILHAPRSLSDFEAEWSREMRWISGGDES